MTGEYVEPTTSSLRKRRSERARERSAVDHEILPGDVAGLGGAKERAGRAELGWIADPLGRHAGDALGHRLVGRDALALGGRRNGGLEPVGGERAGQQIVD